MTDRTETAMTTAVGAAPVAVAAGTALTAAAGPIALAAVGAVGAAVAVRALAKRPKRPGQTTLTKTMKRTQSGGGAGGRLGRLSTGMPRAGRAGGIGGKLGKSGGKSAGKTGGKAGKAGKAGKGGLLGSRSAGTGLGIGQKPKSRMNVARAASGGFARKPAGGKGGGLFGGRSGGARSGGLFGTSMRRSKPGGTTATKRTAWSTNPFKRKNKANAKARATANQLIRKGRREIRSMEMRRIAARWRRWMARRRLSKKRDEAGWFRRLWEGVWNVGVWVSAAAGAAWYWSALRARRLGRRGRSLLADMRVAAAIPFSGLKADWTKFIFARLMRRQAEAGIAQGSTTPVTTSTNGGAMSDNNQPVGPRTNLRELIESIHELGPLGDGEKPHATVVHQWHKDLTEAMEVLSTMIQRDAEVAASTLPSEGAAHEITASLSGVLRSTAEQTLESTTAWELAQGSRLTRLYNGDANEVAWDVSTMPDQ